MEDDRIVITGLGALTPVGNTAAATWDALLAGRSGIGEITLFDTSRVSNTIAAEVRGFDADELLGRREARKMDRVSQFAVVAAREAHAMAGDPCDEPGRVGVIVGSAAGGFATIEEQLRILYERGPDRLSPHFLANMLVDTPSFYIAHDLGIRGPNFAVVSACSTGAHAIGVASDLLRRGDADLVFAGGTEAPITEGIVGGFCVMRALGSPRPGEPLATASRPFDSTRDGFIMAEGAVIVALERESRARARGATPIAAVTSYGASNDAYHTAAPRPDALGVIEMMQAALARAGVRPDEVGYINPHGTSTPLNDSTETAAIRAVFGAHADRLAVSSTKSMTGHLFGAAGALETMVCALALRDQRLPPTANYRDPDPACDLDYVTEGARDVAGLRYALTNSMGLGGHNGCVLLERI